MPDDFDEHMDRCFASIDLSLALCHEYRRSSALARGELLPPDPTHEERLEQLLALRATNARDERNLKRRMQRAALKGAA